MTLLAALLQAAACPATPAPPPPELAGWTERTTIAPSNATMVISRGARITLAPAETVRLPATPGKAPAAGTHSGMLSFVVPTAGRYRVALGAAAWLDVVRDGQALASVAHAHGPACTGIRKTVDFDLQPGRYQLQIVGSPRPAIDAMVARLPDG